MQDTETHNGTAKAHNANSKDTANGPPVPGLEPNAEIEPVDHSDPERTVSLSPIPLFPTTSSNTPNTTTIPRDTSLAPNDSRHSITEIPSEFIFRIFSFLELTELLTVELCCTTFRALAHHPMSFQNDDTLTLLQSHYQYDLYRFKSCKSISFLEISKSMMAERGVSDAIDTFTKRDRPFFQHRYSDRHEQWRSICTAIHHDFQCIETITIPVNFGAMDIVVDEILSKMSPSQRLHRLIIEGQCNTMEGDKTLELDEEYNLESFGNIKRFGLFSKIFDYDLARGLLECPQIEELVINNVLIELNSFTLSVLTTKKEGDSLDKNPNGFRVETLVLNGCHLGTHKMGDLSKYFRFNPSAKMHSENEENQQNPTKDIRLKANGDILCDGVWARNVLIRNRVPYIERCPFTMNHPILLPLRHCEALMLNWAVIESKEHVEVEDGESEESEERTKPYQLEREIRIGDLSQIKEFSIKFHNESAMNSFLPSMQRMNIGENVERLCLCINDYHKSFENHKSDTEGVITRFMDNLFGGKNGGIDSFRIEFRKASWMLVDAAMNIIVEKCASKVKRFEFLLFEPRYAKYRGRKKDKLEWEYKNRLNTTGNVLDELVIYLKNADSVHVKLSYVEEFADHEIREFEKEYICDVDEVDEGEFIYEFKRGKRDRNDSQFVFDLDDFEYERS